MLHDLVAKVFPNLVGHLARQLRSGVEHDEDDRAQLQGRIQVASDEIDVANQLSKALECVVLGLNRYEYLGRSSQPVDRQQAKRWGTIDKDNVVVLTHGLDGILELSLTVHGRHEFDLRAR